MESDKHASTYNQKIVPIEKSVNDSVIIPISTELTNIYNSQINDKTIDNHLIIKVKKIDGKTTDLKYEKPKLSNDNKPKYKVYMDLPTSDIEVDEDDDINEYKNIQKQKEKEKKEQQKKPENVLEKLENDLKELKLLIPEKPLIWSEENNRVLHEWISTLINLKKKYKYILTKCQNISNTANLISTISSFILGILSAFKLAFKDDIFSMVTDIILMIFNFIIAIISITAKRYLEGSRIENIQLYLTDLDIMINKLVEEQRKINKTINGDEYINTNIEDYNNLTCDSKIPEISEYENQEYEKYATNRERKKRNSKKRNSKKRESTN